MLREPDEIDALLERAVAASERRDGDVEVTLGSLARGIPLDVTLRSVRTQIGEQRFNLVERELTDALLAYFDRGPAVR